jgi:predicted Zn-dependent protease
LTHWGLPCNVCACLEAAENNWEKEEWSELRKQALLLRKQGLPAVAQSVLQQVISAEGDPGDVTTRLEILLEMDQFPLVSAEISSEEKPDETMEEVRNLAAESERNWEEFARSVRDRFAPPDEGPESNLLEGARFYIRSGNPKNAGALLSEYLNRYGENDITLALRAELYMAGGRWEDAVRCFSEADARRPLDPETRCLLGKALIRKGAFQEAETLLTEMCASESPEPSVFELLAEVLLVAGRPQEAISLLERATARFPDRPSFVELRRRAAAKT